MCASCWLTLFSPLFVQFSESRQRALRGQNLDTSVCLWQPVPAHVAVSKGSASLALFFRYCQEIQYVVLRAGEESAVRNPFRHGCVDALANGRVPSPHLLREL